MSEFLAVQSVITITKPDGAVIQRPVVLYHCPGMGPQGSIGIKLVGDSPLKGYMIDVFVPEIHRVMQSGVPLEKLPDEI